MTNIKFKKKNKSPIFLIGKGKGSTALLMKILNSVPDVLICDELEGVLKLLTEAYFINTKGKASIGHIYIHYVVNFWRNCPENFSFLNI